MLAEGSQNKDSTHLQKQARKRVHLCETKGVRHKETSQTNLWIKKSAIGEKTRPQGQRPGRRESQKPQVRGNEIYRWGEWARRDGLPPRGEEKSGRATGGQIKASKLPGVQNASIKRLIFC